MVKSRDRKEDLTSDDRGRLDGLIVNNPDQVDGLIVNNPDHVDDLIVESDDPGRGLIVNGQDRGAALVPGCVEDKPAELKMTLAGRMWRFEMHWHVIARGPARFLEGVMDRVTGRATTCVIAVVVVVALVAILLFR